MKDLRVSVGTGNTGVIHIMHESAQRDGTYVHLHVVDGRGFITHAGHCAEIGPVAARACALFMAIECASEIIGDNDATRKARAYIMDEMVTLASATI